MIPGSHPHYQRGPAAHAAQCKVREMAAPFYVDRQTPARNARRPAPPLRRAMNECRTPLARGLLTHAELPRSQRIIDALYSRFSRLLSQVFGDLLFRVNAYNFNVDHASITKLDQPTGLIY